MPDFTHEFVSSFVPAYQRGSEQGMDVYNKAKSFRMMQAQFDLDKQLKLREAEIRESEEADRQAKRDIEMADLKRDRDLEKRKTDLAMGIRETESRIEKLKSAGESVKRVKLKGRGGEALPSTSNKQALEILGIKKTQAQRELRMLHDPMSMLSPTEKERADIEYTEAGTVLRGAQTKAAKARARLDDKKRTAPEKEEDRKIIWKFASDWLKMSMSPEEKESLSPEQYNQWLGSLVQQYIDGVRPENFQLPQITEKEPTKKSFLGMDFLARDETRADTSFYPFDESEMEKRYLR